MRRLVKVSFIEKNRRKSCLLYTSFLAPMNAHSHVKKVIGIVSGKGGVGKSSITSLLAVLKQREGHNVAILDGDITGPVSYTHLFLFA